MRIKIKVKILAIIFLLNITSFLSLNAQWARTSGTDEDEHAYSIQQTSDGGYIVAGNVGYTWWSGSNSIVDYDFWILKFTSAGEMEWQRMYGIRDVNQDDRATSIQQTSEGGYIVAGYTDSFGAGYYDFWILKLAPTGDIEWQKTYGGYYADGAYSIRQTNDGGYIVAGDTDSFGAGNENIWILKLSSDGTIEWQKTYGGNYTDRAYSIQQTGDGGYIVAGETESFGAGYEDIWILKLTPDGTIEWQKTYGRNYTDQAYSIQQTNDGGYIVAGSLKILNWIRNIWILKLSPDGAIEWQKTYGGSQNECAYSIQQTGDGGYIVAGETRSFGAGYADIWVLKLSLSGTIEWQKTYGGSREEEAYSIQQTGDGGYIVAGSTASYGEGEQDFLLLKLSSNGEIDPACIFIEESSAEVSDTDTSPADTDITPEDTDITSEDTNITPIESEAVVYSLCSGQHTLNLSATSGGTTNPSPGTYFYDHAVRITINADSDDEYNFSEWSGDVSSTARLITIIMDSDKSIKANFNAIIIEDVWEEVKKTPCFIATAAYGSPLHPSVRILRDFRDKYLMSSRPGRVLVDFYYKYSPFLANFLAKHKVLKADVQLSLMPLVAFSYSMVHFGPAITFAVLILIFIPPVCLAWHFQRGSSHLSFPRKRESRISNKKK